MARYEEVRYSRTKIKKAGKIFVDPKSTEEDKNNALVLINNWRAAHAFPLQVIYMHVRKVAPSNAIVAQRLKRLYSITQKLYRFPDMSLTTMQDIGGCRVIVDSLSQVDEMVERILKSRMRHHRKEKYNYIESPKPDGYRSYHLVLSYNSEKNSKYNGLFIEIQIRTHIQHLWATAIEVMDAFTGDPLKIGQGNPQNKHFFVLASKLLEIYEKNDKKIDMVKDSPEIMEFCEFDKKHQVLSKLKSIKEAAQFVQSVQSVGSLDQEYYLLRFDWQRNQLIVKGFTKKELDEATEQYNVAEKTKYPNEDVVLVSTSSYNMLKQAYPNYFSDTTEFIELLEKFMQK